ncbi:MAG: GGDEF domain-containing protein, partial [Planctomycetaceae bacterium]
LDVDFFKSINDTFGHATGDQVLIDIAKLLHNETYSGEIVGRYGGEEFVVLCPGTGLPGGIRKAERLRNLLPATEIGGLDNYKVTASFGVTEADRGDSIESILRRADKALYQAKETGRNKTCSLSHEELTAVQKIEQAEAPQEEPFVFRGHFQACVAADMIVYKLGGFVTDENARLVEVRNGRAVVRHGSRGMVPFWGRTEDRQPVELVIDFGEDHSRRGGDRRHAARKVDVDVCIRPIGWVRKPDVFHARAQRVMRLLRSYFVGE